MMYFLWVISTPNIFLSSLQICDSSHTVLQKQPSFTLNQVLLLKVCIRDYCLKYFASDRIDGRIKDRKSLWIVCTYWAACLISDKGGWFHLLSCLCSAEAYELDDTINLVFNDNRSLVWRLTGEQCDRILTVIGIQWIEFSNTLNLVVIPFLSFLFLLMSWN